jgi:hypothetical protein
LDLSLFLNILSRKNIKNFLAIALLFTKTSHIFGTQWQKVKQKGLQIFTLGQKFYFLTKIFLFQNVIFVVLLNSIDFLSNFPEMVAKYGSLFYKIKANINFFTKFINSMLF